MGGELDWFDWKRPDYGRVLEQRTQRLEALRADPKQWDAIKAYYANNHPADFINDWACTYDPRNSTARLDGVKLPTTMPFVLFPKQREFLEWMLKRWLTRDDGVTEKSRDMGVSWLCVGFGVWMWTFKPGSVIGFGSRKEDYVDKIGEPSCLFWKARTLVRLLPFELRPPRYDEKIHAPHMRLLNPDNESAMIGEAGDNIGRGARASIYFKDESAFYDNQDAVDAALSQTANTKIDVSTPNGEGNLFWRKRHEGKLPVFVFDWRDDPRKNESWYAEQKRKMDPVKLAQEVDRDYSASVSNAMIGSPVVTAAMQKGPMDVRPMGGLRFGLDVARFGDDKCVLSVRRGRVLMKQFKWGKVNLETTAGRAKQLIDSFCKNGERPEQIAVDVIGLGSGAADMLRGWYDSESLQFGRPDPGVGIVVDVNSATLLDDGVHYNLRAFMWVQMKEWLGTASIPNDQELRVALTSLRYGFRGGALLIESKDDAKKRGMRSPDEADSLALTFAYPTVRRTPKPVPKGSIADYAVDPLLGM